MAVTRTIWKNWFTENNIPSWPCPSCNKGTLIGDKKDIKSYEAISSQKLHREEDWDPEQIWGQFTGNLKCDVCEETVVIAGKMAVEAEHVYDEQYEGYNFEYIEILQPNIFVPTLNIFELHKDVPEEVCNAIKESFKLFWIDSSSCANKIRTVVELIMDEQKVPKTYKDRGKRKGYSLHKRIELFKAAKSEEADLLMAIKWIGNSGSHVNDELKKDDTLDAYEILDLVTTRLYEKDSHRIKALSKTINKRKKPIRTKRAGKK
ncbi:DUF4145 domain-containing protein [Longitalea luteola]|uniref:DUF4145 domain-containing protein n=1 Tax=Longitalea luteola TaxID=2812563 RepID=UPI001A95AB89|nr:DUF4145 domain-containing protein [Longitalea luteola]